MSDTLNPDTEQLLYLMAHGGQGRATAEYWCGVLYDELAKLDRTIEQLELLQDLGLVEIQENAAERKNVQWWVTEQGCQRIGRSFDRPRHLKAEPS